MKNSETNSFPHNVSIFQMANTVYAYYTILMQAQGETATKK